MAGGVVGNLGRRLLSGYQDRIRAVGRLIHHWVGLVAVSLVLWIGFLFIWYVFPGWGLN